MGVQDTVDVILRALRRPPASGEHSPSIDDMVAIGAVTNILTRCRDDALASAVWRRLIEAADETPARGLYQVLRNGVVSRFPAAEVVPTLLARLPEGDGVSRWVSYLRLKECVQPVHSVGWGMVTPAALAPVRADAVRAVEHPGRVKTSDVDQKQDAWEVLLCAGTPAALPPVDEAIRGNASGHVTHLFLELAACLAPAPLPGTVARLLETTPAEFGWAPDEYLVAQAGAVRTAHASSTDEAFRSLLRYRPAGEGVLISAIEALADLAARAAELGDRSRVLALQAAAEGPEHGAAESAAGAALARLVERGGLSAEEAARVALHAARGDIDPYARRDLLYAFASRSGFVVPAQLLEAARDLARPGRTPTDDELRSGVVPAAQLLLATRPSAASAPHLPFGLKEADGVIRLLDDAPPVTSHLLAHWYPADPGRFAAAVIDVLASEAPTRVAPVAAAIRRVGAGNPAAVLDAVLARTRRMDGGQTAEPFVIDLLADVAPLLLLQRRGHSLPRWMPQARTALVGQHFCPAG